MINQVFIFSAGAGTRMAPLTKDAPKPLLKVGKKAILDHILDRIRFLKVPNVIINTFYLKKKIKDFAYKHKDNLIISDEFTKVETGGGIKYAIKSGLIDINKPLMLINGDLFWKEDEDFLTDMIKKFNLEKPDILLSLTDRRKYFGYRGEGDFNLLHSGKVIKDAKNPYAFTGVQIINPKIFNKAPKENRFSISHFYHNKSLKINGIVSKNDFFHIGDVDALEEINTDYHL
tara:strand:- start:5098 stop:5790 length:693 start_codon:yes stop_codon:yes gene_type:complete